MQGKSRKDDVSRAVLEWRGQAEVEDVVHLLLFPEQDGTRTEL